MRVLTVDVGFGTTDILIYDSQHSIENCARMVVPSRTQLLAARIRGATRAGAAVAMRGVTMGGGPIGRALKEHLETGLPFWASPEAALTFNDDLERVRSWGVAIHDDPVAAAGDGSLVIDSGDIDLDALMAAFARTGIETEFDGAAIAVQDHGFAPGRSNRKFRFARWRRELGGDGSLDSLAYTAGAVPEPYTRMRAAAALLAPVGVTVAMDTGPAALRGAASVDLQVPEDYEGMIVNCGNGHTLAAIIRQGAVMGLVEHHTGLLDTAKFTEMIRSFAAGTLHDDEVFDQGGHGCMTPAEPFAITFDAPITVTGPQREKFRGSDLPLDYAAPYGDMMLTGCFGLAGAWLRLVAGPSA